MKAPTLNDLTDAICAYVAEHGLHGEGTGRNWQQSNGNLCFHRPGSLTGARF